MNQAFQPGANRTAPKLRDFVRRPKTPLALPARLPTSPLAHLETVFASLTPATYATSRRLRTSCRKSATSNVYDRATWLRLEGGAGRLAYGPPENKASRRSMPLNKTVMAALGSQ